MSNAQKGVLAMIGACMIWGLSPIYYKQLSHVMPAEVLAHRTLWSLVFFAAILAVQRRLSDVGRALSDRRQLVKIVLASLLISVNWFIFILSTQIGKVAEASLGYYIFPLISVLIGRFVFGERLSALQWGAIALAGTAVLVLTLGLGVAPWISLILASTFGLYGMIKKGLTLGPVVSVTCEILIIVPLGLMLLTYEHGRGRGVFGRDLWDSGLLILSGPLTALPLILFSAAAHRIALSLVGVLQYLNPSLQFFCAVVVFGEAFTGWHGIAFSLIWGAVALFSLAAVAQDRATRRASMAAVGVAASVRKADSE